MDCALVSQRSMLGVAAILLEFFTVSTTLLFHIPGETTYLICLILNLLLLVEYNLYRKGIKITISLIICKMLESEYVIVQAMFFMYFTEVR